MNLVAYKLEQLQSEVDYTANWITTNPQITEDTHRNYAGAYDKLTLFAFIVTSAGSTGVIRLWAEGNDDYVEIPISTLKIGEVYHIYLSRYEISNGGNATLVGMFSKNRPYELD